MAHLHNSFCLHQQHFALASDLCLPFFPLCCFFSCCCSIDNRAVLELKGPLFGGNPADVAIVTAADPLAVKRRTQHGCLMAVNFILVFPLGALLARQLRARWLNSLAAKAVLFYMHIALQVGQQQLYVRNSSAFGNTAPCMCLPVACSVACLLLLRSAYATFSCSVMS